MVLVRGQAITWKTKFCSECCLIRSASLQNNSNVSKNPPGKSKIQDVPTTKSSKGRTSLVAHKRLSALDASSKPTVSLHRDRRIRRRLGCYNKREEALRSLEQHTKTMALQSKRIVDCIYNLTKATRTTSKEDDHHPNRQSHGSVIHSETRRYKIPNPLHHGFENSQLCTGKSDDSHSEIFAGALQRSSRQPVQTKIPSGVALRSPNKDDNLPSIGNTRNRLIRNKDLRCRTKVCERRPQGQAKRIHGCVQQTVELQTSLDIPATCPHTTNTSASEYLPRPLYSYSTEMGESILESRSEEACSTPPIPHQELESPPFGLTNEPTTSRHQESIFGGLENTGWSNEINNWNEKEKEFLETAWRKSTLKTYTPAWKSWLRWANDNDIPPATPKACDLAKYLIFLYEVRKLSPRTILVHKSVVSNFTKPSSYESLSKHPLVQKTIKAILLKNPPSHKITTWNVEDLLSWMSQHVIDETNLFQVSQHVAILLLLATGRRIHDLTLLHIDPSSCHITEEEILLWPKFGSKTDCSKFRQSGWRILKNEIIKFNLCHWIPILIDISKSRRNADPSLNTLFITTRSKVKAASRTIIAGWVKLALKAANINATPGSFRSAVATNNWTKRGLDLDEVLAKGNWRSANIFLKHYFKEISRDNNAASSISDFFSTI